MSIRTKSHADLPSASLDEGLRRSFSMSSSDVNKGGRSGNGATEEVKVPPRSSRRPVRVVRPVSAVGSSGSFIQMNHLQGELVRKRKECEDLKRENKHLSNEIHMERIVMRTESELTMRSLRNQNQELQTQVKELKQKSHQSQQRAASSSRAADEAEAGRGDAERSKAQAEARALGWRRDKEATEADRERLAQELKQLRKEHSDLQVRLTQTERNYFESQLKLQRTSGEKEALLQESKDLEGERDELRLKLREITQENIRISDSEATWRRRAAALEEQSDRAGRAQREAEAERRLLDQERQERTAESLGWREKHRELDRILRAQEELRAERQNKACQASIKSFLLCMTESDQRVKILRNADGSARSFTEGDPVFISSPEFGPEEPERSSSRNMMRVSAPGPGRFDELPAFAGERPESGPPRRGRKVVEYFWIPTEQD